jgi:hypothetical protein
MVGDSAMIHNPDFVVIAGHYETTPFDAHVVRTP